MSGQRRIAQLRERLAEEGVAALIVAQPVNIAYLTGFKSIFDDEPAHVALVTADELVLYTDGRYSEAVRTAAEPTAWQVRVPTVHLYQTVCDDLASVSGPVAMEQSVPHGRFSYVQERLGELVASSRWVEEIRQVKEAEEIASIAAAQALTDAAFSYIRDRIRPGLTERDIALDLEFFMRKQGSEGVAFDPIVASGPNSARPHAKVSGRVVARGDFVKLDFGARVDGYCSDMTRTVVVGVANDRQREIYDAVLSANVRAVEAVRGGMRGSEADAVARSVLKDRGLADLFTHGLGHGVGLEIHEAPGVGPRSDDTLLAGSVITVEPGVYEPGVGGVRIEDLVVVEERGCTVLTSSAKELLEV